VLVVTQHFKEGERLSLVWLRLCRAVSSVFLRISRFRSISRFRAEKRTLHPHSEKEPIRRLPNA